MSSPAPSLTRTDSSKPPLSKVSSQDSGYQSPQRQHERSSSSHHLVKETRNAHSQYSNSEDDGTSQLRINQYLIRQEIGRGSFGAVHLATDQYDTEYAVKEFSKTRLRRRAQSNLLRRTRTSTHEPHAAGGSFSTPLGLNPILSKYTNRASSVGLAEDPFNLIKEEIAVMKKLNHTNIVSLIEVLDDPAEDSLFMVLEMCKKGVVMKIEVEDDVDPYPEENCRTWFRDLILGIEYLHAQGVIHRDIKPDNCLLTDDDTLKVVDFGVSEIFEKSSDMKVAKSAGSPAFQAPELCTIGRGDIDGKPADIWSMGVTLYCMIYGRTPFRKPAVLELYKSIVEDSFPIPEDTNPDLADLFRRILEKEPHKRIKMDALRNHPWVTLGGTDPLLPTEENCAEIISPPTDSEMNAAITGNMGRVIAVMKAVNRFKAIVDKKRPGFAHSILGSASRFVRPPLSMTHSEEAVHRIWGSHKPPTKDEVEAAHRALEEQGDYEGAQLLRELDKLPEALKGVAVTSSDKDDPEAAAAMGTLHKSKTAPLPFEHQDHDKGKGHAHNVLEDQLYLSIGQGPSFDENSDPTSPIVCESPPATDFNVYEKAYKTELQNIYKDKGRRATVYLTRRVEDKVNTAHEYLTGSGARDHAEMIKGSAKGGLASLVGKATSAAHTAGQYADGFQRGWTEGKEKDTARH